MKNNFNIRQYMENFLSGYDKIIIKDQNNIILWVGNKNEKNIFKNQAIENGTPAFAYYYNGEQLLFKQNIHFDLYN